MESLRRVLRETRPDDGGAGPKRGLHSGGGAWSRREDLGQEMSIQLSSVSASLDQADALRPGTRRRCCLSPRGALR